MPDHAENSGKPELKTEGRYAYEGIDRVIHEKARLSIVASLAAHGAGLLFNDLKDLCTLTDGNLSRHLAVLQDAGLVEVKKSFKHNRPQSWCKLTALGKRRFADYVAELEQVVADALKRESQSRASAPPRGILPA